MKRILALICYMLLSITSSYSSNKGSVADSVALQQLYQVAIDHIRKPDRFQHIQALLAEARKSGNEKYETNAMFLLMKHYYSVDLDSLFYWLEKSTPLFMKQKRYEDMFRTKAWGIYVLTKAKRNKAALDSIHSLKGLAVELNYPDGKDMANQALADYYLSNNLEEEGVKLYEEVLAEMEQRNAPLVKQVYIIRQLVNLMPGSERKFPYLERLQHIIDLCDRDGIRQLDSENPVSFLRYILYRSYAMLYLHMDNYPRALAYLKKTEDVVRKNKMAYKDSEIKTMYATYYNRSGQYDKAVQICDALLTYYENTEINKAYLDVLKLKAQAFMNGGRYQESSYTLMHYAQLKDSLTSAGYYKELAEMQAQHNMDKLELANKQMELQVMADHNKVVFLWSGVIVLGLICCLLGYLAYTVYRFGNQLKVAKEKAEEADHMKSAFLANMNHEIRTPLNAIVGFSQILVDEEDPETRLEYFNIIQSNNELLQRLISDVLDISKIESNSMKLSYAQLSLPELMGEIYNVIRLRIPEGVKLELTDCIPFIFHMDRNRLTQILTNLLTNAIKHTQTGVIRFGYELEEATIRFFVQDTGEGIPQEQMDNIFSRFVQLDSGSKGVGLGLAICKGLVLKMGGSIEVISRLGEGSTFFVILPFDFIPD